MAAGRRGKTPLEGNPHLVCRDDVTTAVVCDKHDTTARLSAACVCRAVDRKRGHKGRGCRLPIIPKNI